MRLPSQPTLTGELVRLEPLDAAHFDGLRRALEVDRATFGWTIVPTPATVGEYAADRFAQRDAGQMSPYAQIEVASGEPVGHTTYCNPKFRADGSLYAVEVGYTWLIPASQAGALNSESKLLMLTHAFETLGVARVELRTDARNERSRAAIEAIGGVFEGVLRNVGMSRVPGEDLRDEAVFSIVRPEWPTTKERLHARLERKRAAS